MNVVPHLNVDEGIAPERLVQIRVAINHHERDRNLHKQMLEQNNELNCLLEIRSAFQNLQFSTEAEVGCTQNKRWPYDFVPFLRHDAQVISATKMTR